MTDAPNILILAGTSEVRDLASHLSLLLPQASLTASFAGAISNLPNLGIPTRTGGFGGVDGIAAYLQRHSVDLVVDATHPFAAQMTRHAATACLRTNTPFIRLQRPSWKETAEDNWLVVAGLDAAAEALPPGARPFIAVGRKEIQTFCHRTDLQAIVRMIEPPMAPLPESWLLMLSRPARSVEEELDLLTSHNVTHIVSKNSGGERSYGKIAAARQAGVQVIMISRPFIPQVDTHPDVTSACTAIMHQLYR
jgi:precorrin-6A/cobalt-precorrin-6A reductase